MGIAIIKTTCKHCYKPIEFKSEAGNGNDDVFYLSWQAVPLMVGLDLDGKFIECKECGTKTFIHISGLPKTVDMYHTWIEGNKE